MGNCAGHFKDSDGDADEVSLNAIAELEIHYSESNEEKAPAYIFDSLYCITNIQTKESINTGIEDSKFYDLAAMKLQIVDCLTQNSNFALEALKRADVFYIMDDIE